MQAPDGSPRSTTFSPFDDSVATSASLLPASLRDGGLSAVSSRRPSYAAEFATRPRLIESLGQIPGVGPATGSGQAIGSTGGSGGSGGSGAGGTGLSAAVGGSIAPGSGSPLSRSSELPKLGVTVSNPTVHPLIDTDRWLSQLGRGPNAGIAPNWSLWNVPSQAAERTDDGSSSSSTRLGSPPKTGSNLENVLASPGTPVGSEFVLPASPGQKKNFRSLSFPHATVAPPPSGARQPPYVLDTFAEEDYDDERRQQQSPPSNEQQHQQQHQQLSHAAAQVAQAGHPTPIGQNPLFWGPASRRHSYAGEHLDDSINTTTTTSSTGKNISNDNSNWNGGTRHDSNDGASGASAVARKQAPHQNQNQNQSQNQNQNQNQNQGENQNHGGTAAAHKQQQQHHGDGRTNGTTMDKKLELHIDRYFSFDRKGSVHPSDQQHPPLTSSEAAALISVPSRKLYFVQFKGGRIDVFYIPENSNLVVMINDLVIVDADRGRDLGRVVKDHVTLEEAGMLKYRRHHEQKAILQHNPNAANGNASASMPPVTMPKQILRYAQLSEIHQIVTKEVNEEKAVAMCMHKVEEKGLSMTVIDAEYQWDGRKLTFFYSASHRIDFRDLVRELFRIYKTRIWMCAVNSSADAPLPLPPTPAPTATSGPEPASKESPSASTKEGDHSMSHQQYHGAPHYEYGLVAAQLLGGPPSRQQPQHQSRPQHHQQQQHQPQRMMYPPADLWGAMQAPMPPPGGAYSPAAGGVPMFVQGPGGMPLGPASSSRKQPPMAVPPSYGYPGGYPNAFGGPPPEQSGAGQYWNASPPPPPGQPYY